ncbi:MAG TPA: 2-hydroxyacyl-CoA dehydratase family protein [Rectinema sp.]|nr:2-hydroxyacyl-CoA dehydratase family protein [Rectinema sp.]
MNSIVHRFGRAVSSQVPQNPQLSRNILAAGYTLSGWKDAYFGGKGLKGVYAHMNAAISRNMSHSFKDSSRSAMVNIFFPCELLYAMDITAVFPEALSVYIANSDCEAVFAESAEAIGISESLCSYHKIMIGTARTGVLPKPLLIANTTLACDANQLSFRYLAEEYGSPHFIVDVPHTVNKESVHYVASQLKNFTVLLEDLLHSSMSESKLRYTVDRANRTIKAYREYLNIRARTSLPISMTGELFSLVATHVFLGTPESEQYAIAIKELAQKASPDRRKKRILWLHTLPNWQDSIRVLLENNERTEILASDMTYDTLIDMDPEKPYESMAERLVYNINNGGAQRRIDAAIAYAKKLHADGVIVFGQWGCKQTMGMSQLAKMALEEEGFPTLVLDGDGCDPRNVADGQMATRVNAFLEQLEASR